MPNLIAYIPVLNQRHVDWFRKHPGSDLCLISQTMAEGFLPRLARNMSAVPTEMMVEIIRSLGLVKKVSIFSPDINDPAHESSFWDSWVVADEDVSCLVANKYLISSGVKCTFELIWARWDMSAVQRQQPIIADVAVSSSVLDNLLMDSASVESSKSPDWWRQIGAVVVGRGGHLLASAHNTHMPNEYETYIFGDPRLNVDAGQKGTYCSIHAERAIIALCAKNGLSLQGASLYVSTFPCEDCAREIAFAGISKLFFLEGYSVLNAQEVLRSHGVTIIQVVKDPVSA